MNELRYAFRSLGKSPGLTAVAVALLSAFAFGETEPRSAPQSMTGQTTPLPASVAPPRAIPPSPAVVPSGAPRVVILADPADSYQALAAEIARAEGHAVVHNLGAALDAQPVFLVWVASPVFLTESALCKLGSALADRGSMVSVGIISGSTLAQASGLWQRASRAKGDVRVHAIAPQQILDYSSKPPTSAAFSREELRAALGRADY